MSIGFVQVLSELGVHVPDVGQHQIRCPFHGGGREADPSARVYNETQSVYCFSCKRSWDLAALLSAARRCSRAEAERLLGLRPPAPKSALSRTDSVVDITKAARAILGAEAYRLLLPGVFDVLASGGEPDLPAIRKWLVDTYGLPRLESGVWR